VSSSSAVASGADGAPVQLSESARRRSIILFSASMLLFWAALYVYMPILPVYAEHLGASMTLVGLVVGIYGFTQLAVRIPLGMWSDQIGKRKPFVVLGMAAAVVGCLAMAWAPDAWYLVLGRATIGLAASTWVASTVLFSSYFPPNQAVKAVGLATFFSGVPQVITGPVGGILAESYGWTFPFFVGAALGAVGLLCLVGMEEAPIRSTKGMSLGRLRSIGTVPLLVAVSCVGILNHFSSFATTYAFTPIYAQGTLGATKVDLGNMLAVSMVAYSLATLVAFRFTERLGERTVVTVSMLLGAASTVATPFIGDLTVLIAFQFVQGLARGMVYPVLMGLSMRAVSAEDRATAVGIFQASYAIGMFAGPTFGGVIADQIGLAGVFYLTGIASLGAALVGWFGIHVHREIQAQALAKG
jgi:MFS family permease